MSAFNVSNPKFLPTRRSISAITRANPAVVTTDIDHKYLSGDVVRFYIPDTYNMRQMHHKKGQLTKLTDTTFEVDIDTREFDAFIAPASPEQYAYVIWVGDTDPNLAFTNVSKSGSDR